MNLNRDTRLAMLSTNSSVFRTKPTCYRLTSKMEPQKVDASTQTINKERDLDPINYSRLYINGVFGNDVHEKRKKFYDDLEINHNIRKRYFDFVNDNDGYDNCAKLRKVDRRYHLLDNTLNTNILKMSPEEIQEQFSGIGWSYLGLQARMEYQKAYCQGSTEEETDSMFFKDINVRGNLKLGYSRWKKENVKSKDCKPVVIIKKAIDGSNDLIELSNILPDPSLKSGICKMSDDQIQKRYSGIDKKLLGLQARLEYAHADAKKDRHLADIDFILEDKISLSLRTSYKQWLAANILYEHEGKLYAKKRDT